MIHRTVGKFETAIPPGCGGVGEAFPAGNCYPECRAVLECLLGVFTG